MDMNVIVVNFATGNVFIVIYIIVILVVDNNNVVISMVLSLMFLRTIDQVFDSFAIIFFFTTTIH